MFVKIFLVPFFLISTLFYDGCDNPSIDLSQDKQNTILCEKNYKDRLNLIAYSVEILNNRLQYKQNNNKTIALDSIDYTIAMFADKNTAFIDVSMEDFISSIDNIIQSCDDEEDSKLIRIFKNFKRFLQKINEEQKQKKIQNLKKTYLSPNFKEQTIDRDPLDGCSYLNYELVNIYRNDSVEAYTVLTIVGEDSSRQKIYIPDTVALTKTVKWIPKNEVFIPNDFYEKYISVKVSVPANFFYIISR